MKKRILFFIVGAVLVVVLFGNFTAKTLITRYIESRFDSKCKIEKLKFFGSGLIADDIMYDDDSFNLLIKKVVIMLNFKEIFYSRQKLNFSINLEKIKITKKSKNAANLNEGPPFFLQGEVAFKNCSTGCANLSLRNLSPSTVVAIALKDNRDLSFGGLFAGKVRICFLNKTVSAISAVFENNDDGFINIKKKTALDFLRGYLDDQSYELLIDSLQNYKYNEGKVDVAKNGQDLTVTMLFDSDQTGERNLTVNLYNVLGE
ncbi:MAG: hypothetical protein GY858_09980 [Candidatus Omnitrophica bacterium]|nr:hypothetical protein [Candidatus Omnitrophota bacterium]